jgi:hypothetical protein
VLPGIGDHSLVAEPRDESLDGGLDDRNAIDAPIPPARDHQHLARALYLLRAQPPFRAPGRFGAAWESIAQIEDSGGTKSDLIECLLNRWAPTH